MWFSCSGCLAEAVTAGYSGTPLAKKLGIEPGTVVHSIGAPTHYRSLLEPLPEGVTFAPRRTGRVDLIHLFVTSRARLAHNLPAIRNTMRPDAAVWVSWPKRASGVATDVTETVVRELALPLGLVDVKVCAVDEVWSGLRLVVRKALRPR